MTTIYLVLTSQYSWDSVLNGFATGPAGVARLVENYLRIWNYPEDVIIHVSMSDMTATVTHPGLLREETYYIKELKEVT